MRSFFKDWSLVFAAAWSTSRFGGLFEDEIDLAGLKAGKLDLEVQAHQRLQLDRKDLPVPSCLLSQTIVGQDIGPLFNVAEVPQLHGGHLLNPQQLCGRHPAMAGNDLALVVDE